MSKSRTRQHQPAFLVAAFLTIAMSTGPLAQAANSGDAGPQVDASSTQSAGGGEISVSITEQYTTASFGGGGGETVSSSTSISVKPSCYYEKQEDQSQVGRDAWDLQDQGTKNKEDEVEKVYSGYKRSKEDRRPGIWWRVKCNEDAFENLAAMQAARNRMTPNGATYLWVPDSENGGKPPAPYISGRALATAAWKAVKIPQPTIETNPKVGSQGATLVGMDTWVWATGNTPRSVTVTASAGSTSATVTAASAGLQLSAPDGKPSCQGFGIAWHSGMPEGSSPCTISFNRSSAHLGGTTPLTVSVAYSATYTATDGSSGDLPAVTATNTINLPVAEVQTLTTNSKNPRQN